MMFFTTAVDFVCAIAFSPMLKMIVMIAIAPQMIRVLTLIAIALFFIGHCAFHRLRSFKVDLVLKRLLSRVRNQHHAEARFAFHHAGISISGLFQRNCLDHRADVL